MGELIVSAPEASAHSSVYASEGQDVESVIVFSPVPFMPVHTGFSCVGPVFPVCCLFRCCAGPN